MQGAVMRLTGATPAGGQRKRISVGIAPRNARPPGCAPWPPAEERRDRPVNSRSLRTRPEGASGVVRTPALRWSGDARAHSGACKRGQGRSCCSTAISRSREREPVLIVPTGRTSNASSGSCLRAGLPAQRHDRNLRRRLRADRRAATAAARQGAARAARPARRRGRAARRARGVGPLRRLRRLARCRRSARSSPGSSIRSTSTAS